MASSGSRSIWRVKRVEAIAERDKFWSPEAYVAEVEAAAVAALAGEDVVTRVACKVANRSSYELNCKSRYEPWAQVCTRHFALGRMPHTGVVSYSSTLDGSQFNSLHTALRCHGPGLSHDGRGSP